MRRCVALVSAIHKVIGVELAGIGTADKLEITSARDDGTLCPYVAI